MDTETIDYKDYTIHIIQDTDPLNPREEEEDNAGKMVCFHKRYNLGDKHDYRSSDYDSWKELESAIRQNEDVVIMLPLFLYDHSGITMYTTGNIVYHQWDAWDSMFVGFIYLTRETILKEWGYKRLNPKRAEFLTNYLKGEVQTYDQYLRGDVYGYSIDSPDEENIDSCWGFYGFDFCVEEAKSVVDYYVEHKEEEVLQS